MMKKVMMIALVVCVALVAVEAVNMRKITHKKALIQVERDGIPTRAFGKSLVTGFCAESEWNYEWCEEIREMNVACHDDGTDRNQCITLYKSVQATFTAWCAIAAHKAKCLQLYEAWDSPIFRLPEPTYSSTGRNRAN